MIDVNDLIRKCMSSADNAQTRGALEKVLQAAQSQKHAVSTVSPNNAAKIEQAVAAAQRGDKDAARAAISGLLNTPDGAALAKQIQSLIGK